MKVLIVGDTHGNYQFMKDMLYTAYAENIDTVIQVGDFGFIWNDEDYKTGNLKAISNICVDLGIELAFLPGNHEGWNALDKLAAPGAPMHEVLPNVLYMGKINRFKWGNATVGIAGGAFSIDKAWRTTGFDWFPQETLTMTEIGMIEAYDQVDIMLTHDAPTTVPLGLINIPESHIHRQQMDRIHDHWQPKLWLHGHYHKYMEYWHKNTRVYGLDCDGKTAVNNVILDTNTLAVTVPDPWGGYAEQVQQLENGI